MTEARSCLKAPECQWVYFLAISSYLIISFLWRTLTPAYGHPAVDLQAMEFAFDILAVTTLVCSRFYVSRGKALFVIALLAGIGLLALRADGDAGFLTGHLTYVKG